MLARTVSVPWPPGDLDHLVAGVVDGVDVVALAARHRVAPAGAVEGVVAVLAAEDVVAGTAAHRVVTRTGKDRVVARTGDEHVVAWRAVDDRAAGAGDDAQIEDLAGGQMARVGDGDPDRAGADIESRGRAAEGLAHRIELNPARQGAAVGEGRRIAQHVAGIRIDKRARWNDEVQDRALHDRHVGQRRADRRVIAGKEPLDGRRVPDRPVREADPVDLVAGGGAADELVANPDRFRAVADRHHEVVDLARQDHVGDGDAGRQLQGVGLADPGIERGDDVGARAAPEQVGVVAGPAVEQVVARAAVEHVGAAIADECVGDAIARRIDRRAADERQVLDVGAEAEAHRGLDEVAALAGASLTTSPTLSTT